jgi:hypothetical protein
MTPSGSLITQRRPEIFRRVPAKRDDVVDLIVQLAEKPTDPARFARAGSVI